MITVYSSHITKIRLQFTLTNWLPAWTNQHRQVFHRYTVL